MGATERFIDWLRGLRLLRLDLIRREIAPRDRRWFAECQIGSISRFPWLASDAVRSILAVALAWGDDSGRTVPIATVLAALWCIETTCIRFVSTTDVDRWQVRLLILRSVLVVRALVWAGVCVLLLRHASVESFAPLLFFVTTMILFDTICMIALPVTGLIAGLLLVTAITGALATIAQSSGLIVLLGVLQALAIHFTLFNLHYQFATRRLRTRHLRAANDTIRVLLAQYEEHGTDVLVEIDVKGRIARASSKLCEALDRPADQLVGVRFLDFFEPSPALRAIIADAHAMRRFQGRLLSLKRGEERRWWSLSGCPLYDEDGHQCGWRGFAQDVTERRASEERIHTMATTDTLTGLANRAVFTQALAAALAEPARHPAALLVIDLDTFKAINDTMGHAAGDAVLVEAAQRIVQSAGPEATVARLGGDEFAVILRDRARVAEAVRTGARIAQTLARPLAIDGKSVVFGGSVGIALAPDHASTPDALMRLADTALYAAKSRGRGRCVRFHPEMLVAQIDRRDLEADLRQALHLGQFEVHYQPFVSVATRQVAGYEALLRWRHPERGLVPPVVFIPLAEETGIIERLGAWVLRQALTEAASWREELIVAVNVSPAQMRGEALLGDVLGALSATGVAPERLELEITENMLMQECEAHVRTLHRLRSFGVRIALDDFGTGYSSLNYLRGFPFDKLKIDRSFVTDIARSDESRSIVETVLALAQQFRMETIAEGVEEEDQLQTLADLGCQQAQGFLISRPLPADALPRAHRRPHAGPAIRAVPLPVPCPAPVSGSRRAVG